VAGTPRSYGGGYDYLHVAVDDMSRVAYVAPLSDERGTTCARFLLDAAAFFASHGVRIERVLTDNARNYTMSHAFAAALTEIGARHKRTRPVRPQTNGKAERFNKTLLAEWAYVRRYDTNQARLDALPGFVDRYNCERPHGSLNGQPPMTVLVNNVSGNNS
jgi:transposase InsO family protein